MTGKPESVFFAEEIVSDTISSGAAGVGVGVVTEELEEEELEEEEALVVLVEELNTALLARSVAWALLSAAYCVME